MKSIRKRERLRNLKWQRSLLYLLLPAAIAALLIVWVLQRSAVSAGSPADRISAVSSDDFPILSGPASNSAGVSGNTSAQITAYEPAPTQTQTPTQTPTPTQAPTPTPAREPTAAPAQYTKTAQSQSDGIDWYDGFADPRTINAESSPSPEDLTVLVNKYLSIPEDYAPSLVLAESSKSQYIRVEADDAWDAMRSACETDTGYVLYLCSGYRTFEAQAALFSKSIQNKGIGYACSKNAMEGRSEHNLGLALDISTTDTGVISSGFADTTAGAWVGEHCHEYGFILRYPADKTAVTGYVFEPWHYRYVGIDLAGTLSASGQTLEEYYGKVPAGPAGN